MQPGEPEDGVKLSTRHRISQRIDRKDDSEKPKLGSTFG
jgi:hypothetical protein